jgi:hypothetical protein
METVPVMTGKPIICCDLDSTIAGTLHRQSIIAKVREGSATWDEYALQCPADTPIWGTIELLRLLSSMYEIHIVSIRAPAASDLTQEWLVKHNVPWFVLRLGYNKINYIRELQDQGRDVALFIEDWPQNAAEIWAETGVPVLVVNPCYPPDSQYMQDLMSL